MGKFKVRYLVARKQKGHTLYYWVPLKTYQDKGGFLVTRLAESTNDINDAISEAIQLNEELDAWRRGEIPEAGPTEGTVEWLINEYQKDSQFKALAPKTQTEYSRHLKTLGDSFKGFPINAVSRKAAKMLYQRLLPKPRTAQFVMAIARMMFNHAKDIGLADHNPFEKMRIKSNKPRSFVWSPEEMKEVADKAIELKCSSIALALYMGAYLGQRQADILKACWNQYDGNRIRIKQGKTGIIVDVPCTQALKEILDVTPKTSTQIVISEETQRPYKPYYFRHTFREIMRKTTVRAELQYLDLRRTAVVRLAEAGCSLAEIAAISGHSIESSQKIMEVYLPRTTKMAVNAIAKLERKQAKVERVVESE